MFKLKQHLNKKGFTLIELIVVIAILGILLLLAVPRMASYSQSAKLRADQATVRTLNSITPLARLNLSPDPFSDESSSPEALIDNLVTGGYLTSTVSPQSKDAAFEWRADNARWYLMFGEAFYTISMWEDGLRPGAWDSNMLAGVYSGDSPDIVIPSFITRIWQDVFNTNPPSPQHLPPPLPYEGATLNSVTFDADSQITWISARAFANNAITTIELPPNLERIDTGAFLNNQITEIVLPESVTRIESRAFLGNDLTKITIGSNVTFADGDHNNALGI